MNENISQYLFTYLDNPDPRYAVLLKGKWGCGKTFFIQKWIKSYKSRFDKNEVVLEPIYVSLYGLKDVSQITLAIDRVINPFFYSKGMEITKKVLKVAGKIAFKTSLDVNNDGKEDFSMDATLDSLSLLTSKGEDGIGSKLIVFDDLERSLIDMKLLLGYINNFVEHGACHVIVVGDETHVTENEKKKLDEFKEKTVGREFELATDMDAAIDYFINNNIHMKGWLTNQKAFILDCFKSTRCENLRLLRQCLYDFGVLFSEVDENLLNNSDSFMRGLLGSFIVVYCEYRSEYHNLLKEWDWGYSNGIVGDKETKEKICNLQRKYTPIEDLYKIDVLETNHIKKIVYGIETGYSLKNYVEGLLNQLQGKVNKILQDKIAEFTQLSNEEFEEAYGELEHDIKHKNIPNLYLMGRSLALLVFFDYNQIHSISKDIVPLVKEYLTEYYESIDDKETLYKNRYTFRQGLQSFGKSLETTIGNEIVEYEAMLFEGKNSMLKNKMEKTLLNLDDNNVEELLVLSSESVPDHSCNYNSISILKNIDAEAFTDKILRLNNKSLESLCLFLAQHYHFHCILGNGINRYGDDSPALNFVNERLKEELKQREAIDKYVLKRFLRYLEGAIKRANGENSPIEI